LDIEASGAGQNSGPYSNITFQSSSSTAVCAKVIGVEDTRGIQNLKCIGGGGPVGIYLDGSGNTLEDVSVSGFEDGILIGDSQNARGNVVLNVTGSSSVTNVVHICGSTSTTNCPGGLAVSDLSILQVNRNSATYTVRDDSIATGVGSSLVTDNQVAIYAIGQPMAGSAGYSRFTTASKSDYVPSWLVGSGAPSGSCTTNLQTGTLYSDMSSATHTLWICNGTSWTVVK
jgi:hypothetical protein